MGVIDLLGFVFYLGQLAPNLNSAQFQQKLPVYLSVFLSTIVDRSRLNDISNIPPHPYNYKKKRVFAGISPLDRKQVVINKCPIKFEKLPNFVGISPLDRKQVVALKIRKTLDACPRIATRTTVTL